MITVPISNPIKDIKEIEDDIEEVQNNSGNEPIEEELIVQPEASNDDVDENNISEHNLCPICMSESEKGASICQVCGYSFK